jgi:outer membrane protein assembly factor BamB
VNRNRCVVIPAAIGLRAALFALALSPLSAFGQDTSDVGSKVSSQSGPPDGSVLTYHGDTRRSGHYVVPALSREKAGSLQLDRSFEARVAGAAYAQPLYWRLPGANTGTLFLATEDDVVQAFDATTGKELWRRGVGHPVRGSSLPCGNINPLGITGTPVIDPATQAIYFDAAVERASGPRHEVFALSTKDGSVLPGWPVDVADALKKSGRHFDPVVQNQRAALTIVDGRLYVAFGGHFGDCGGYHGWVIGMSLRDPGQLVSFETRARGGGIWSPGGASVVEGSIYFATGNTFGAASWSDGEAVLRVGADLSRSQDKRDYFAPADWKTLDARDADLGGSNPIPLDVPGAGRADQALILALGKDGKAYLLDRNNLGGIDGQLAVETISPSRIITSPATYRIGNDIFVALGAQGGHCPQHRGGDLVALKITAGHPPVINTAWCGALNGRGSPIVTTDAQSNPIVWMLGAEGDDRLHAFRGDTGEPIFVSEPLGGLRHFQTLIATPDGIYAGADGRIYAFRF